MSQSCFSLRFFSQNSLWKLSTFCGYQGIYSRMYEECKKSVVIQTGHSGDSTSRLEWVTSLSCELTTWPNWNFCLVVLQLLWQFSSPTCSTRVPLWQLASREIQSRDFFDCTHLKFSSHSLTHNPYINLTQIQGI